MTLTDHERVVAEAIAARTKGVDGAVELLEEIAGIFAVSVEAIKGTSRATRLVDARSVIAYVLRERGWMQVEIGDLLNRDHTTVWNLEKRLSKDFELRSLARQVS